MEALHLGADTPGPGPVWPIDTWRSAAWEPDAGETLAAGFVESELPVPEAHFDSERLVKFARARADRVAPFLTDVRRLFDDPAGRQIVLVEEDPETVAHWVALACASLPDAYVSALTFTTWTADPHGAPQQIIGTGPAAGFDRTDEATVTYLYRVHDGTGGPQSPPAAFDAWARLTAERWLSGNPPRPAARAEDAFALLPLLSGGSAPAQEQERGQGQKQAQQQGQEMRARKRWAPPRAPTSRDSAATACARSSTPSPGPWSGTRPTPAHSTHSKGCAAAWRANRPSPHSRWHSPWSSATSTPPAPATRCPT